MKKGTAILDFDYTLFDTVRMKAAMSKAAEASGLSAEAFWAPYEEAHGGGRNRDFDLDAHLRSICERHGCDPAVLKSAMDAIVDRAPDFLFRGAMSLLQRLASADVELILLTHGNPSWQKRRVAKSGIMNRFSRVLFASAEKELSAGLSDLREPVVFIDDNGTEIDALQKTFPSWRMIAVRGPKPLPSDPSVPVCEDLETVYKVALQKLHSPG